VIEMLVKIATGHKKVLQYPPPEAILVNFGDNSLNFQLRVWTEDGDGWPRLRSDLSIAIDQAFKEANIEIPFPQRDLHLRSVDEEAARRLLRTVEATDESIPLTKM
jgi:potassium-dependent mechanosensitive channel